MDNQLTTQANSQAAQPPAAYPVTLDISYPERSSRLWALGTLLFFIPKMIALIPHIIIIYVLSFVATIVMIIGQIVVLFAGRYPRSLFNFVVGVTRWQTRVNAFMIGLTDNYPPFTFK